MMNNFDKMKTVQTTLDNLSSSVSADTSSVEVKETSGNVTAVTEGTVQEIEKKEAEDAEQQTQPGSPDSQENAAENQETDAQNSENPDSAAADKSQVNGSDGVYIVEEGDTLAIISRKIYGDISHVEAIAKMNGLTDGNLIYIGQKLLLP